MRNDVDWPTSVRNISARLGPIQSMDKSVEALRNGKTTSDTSGPFAALPPILDVSLPLSAHPPMATAAATAPAEIHFQASVRWGAAARIVTDAETGRFPRHASRSASISGALW